MNLHANGIRRSVWHVSQPHDGPEWVKLGRSTGSNESPLIQAVRKYG